MEIPQEETSDVGEGEGSGVNEHPPGSESTKREDPPPTIVRMSAALGSMTEDTSSMNGKVQVAFDGILCFLGIIEHNIQQVSFFTTSIFRVFAAARSHQSQNSVHQVEVAG